MAKYVITIARQFGSLGRPIARRMSEMLGIEYYDRDIVDAVAAKTELPRSTVIEVDEKINTGFFRMMFPLGQNNLQVQNQVVQTQREIILNLAEQQNCIIVGRCSDYILENVENHLRIYIYASYEKRLENCIKTLLMEPEEAKRMIREVDKARDAYHRHYAGYTPGDINYKDILIDSGMLGVEGTAEYLAELVKKRFMSGSEKQ